MPPKIRVLLVEDSRLLRDGLSSMLSAHPDFDIVDAIPTTEGVVDVVAEHDPDLVLMDVGSRVQATRAAIRSILESDPATKIVVMDLLPVQTETVDFVKAGVSGFILKDATFEDFVRVAHVVVAGENHLPDPMTKTLFSQIAVEAMRAGSPVDLDNVPLTRREKEIAELIAEGLANKEIAQQLNLATQTVKSHVHNVLRKLGCESRVQIAAFTLSRRRPGVSESLDPGQSATRV
jgi:DNA-binding NarL/FixJ family response regulator